MSFSHKDAKIAYYAAKYHTNELVEKILGKYHDDTLSDDEKKKKIGRYSAAIAIRNIKKTSIKSVPVAKSMHTFEIVDEIEKLYNDASLSDDDKKKKISLYCLSLALRRGVINITND